MSLISVQFGDYAEYFFAENIKNVRWSLLKDLVE